MQRTETAAPCELLEWDSDFFGFRIGRMAAHLLTPEAAERADHWCRQNGVRCLYFLASAEDPATLSVAEENGFRLVDARVTLGMKRGEPSNGSQAVEKSLASLRPALACDLPALRKIAAYSHTDSRFYHDPNFPRELCSRLYEAWIDASFNGTADAVWVAELDSVPVGYATCHRDLAASEGRIGLLGVSEQARGKNLGKSLVGKALEWLSAQGVTKISVVTQGRNIVAQRLYQRCGFLTESFQFWFHKWYGSPGSPQVSGRGYRIPFNRTRFEGDELRYIGRAIADGQISGDGPFVKQCEEFLEKRCGVPKVLLTTSCTHALELCALALNLQPGDEVILPSFTFVSTANAFVLRGARPVFSDVRPDTLNLDEAHLSRLISPRTRAIVPVHYGGVGCAMDRILEIAGQHRIPVVEDNAHGLFGRYRGKRLGTFGGLSAHSFHATKNVTSGEGGALFINDPAYIDRAEILRDKGTDRSKFFRGQVGRYTWVDVGSSYVPSGILAAFLLAQLEASEKIQAKRRFIWDYYAEQLRDWAQDRGVRLPVIPPECEQSYHLFYLLLPSERKRDALMEHLHSKGILTVFHYVPLHLSEMGKRWGAGSGRCPVAEEVSRRILRLPFYNDLSQEALEDVTSAIREFK